MFLSEEKGDVGAWNNLSSWFKFPDSPFFNEDTVVEAFWSCH